MGQCCTHPPDHLEARREEPIPNGTGSFVAATSNGTDWRGQYQPEFVNGMIQAVWPSMEGFSKKVLETNIIPKVRQAIGSKFGSDFSIDFDNYSIGKTPVRFSAMTITEGHQVGVEDGELKVMNVRTRIEWDGDISVYAVFKGIKGGVTKMSIRGDLLMELVGASPNPPLFQGVRCCFINPPEIKIHYDAPLMKTLMSVGPVDAIVHKVLDEEVSKKLVIPNRMGVRFDPTCEMFKIVKPRPSGLLKLHFIRGEALTAMDISMLGRASSDPFIKIKCGAMQFESPHYPNTLSPTFDWTALLPIDLPHDQLINIEVWDKDTLTANDLMGVLPPLRVLDLINKSGTELCHELVDKDGKTGKCGKIFFTSEWRPLVLMKPGHDAKHMLYSDSAVVFVGIYFANHLPVCNDTVRYWVEANCTHRLGLAGDAETPRFTGKVGADHAVPPSDVDTFSEKKHFLKKKNICKKYNMSQEEMATLLDVDAHWLDQVLASEDPTQYDKAEAQWNKGLEFFISNPQEAVLTLTLRSSASARKESCLGNMVNKMTNSPDAALGTWTVRIEDLIKNDHDPRRVFEVQDGVTLLHTRLQVRTLGEPINMVHDCDR